MEILSVIVIYHPANNKWLKLADCLKQSSHVVLIMNDDLHRETDYESYRLMNRGTAGAYNYVIDNFNFDYLWLWDQDSYVQPSEIEKFLKFSKKIFLNLSHIGVISFSDKKNLINTKIPKEFDELLVAKSSGSLFSSECIKKVGLFDEELFLDYVDYDYMLRCRANSYYCIQPKFDSKFKHTYGEKYVTFFGEIYAPSPERLKIQSRNTLLVIRKKHFHNSIKIKLIMRMFLWVFYSLIFSDRKERIVAILSSIK